jgi:hypothetical protein
MQGALRLLPLPQDVQEAVVRRDPPQPALRQYARHRIGADPAVLVLPFLLVIWLSPLAVFSSGLRDRKRRFTIGHALSWLALLAVAFVFRAPADGVMILGVAALYAIPFVFAILYVPKPWDLVIGVTWSFGALLALLRVFSLAQKM